MAERRNTRTVVRPAARIAHRSLDLARRGLNSAALSIRWLRLPDQLEVGSSSACTDFVAWLSEAKDARVR